MPRDLPVTDVMSRKVVTVTESMTIEECARLFTEKGISGAPVVNETGHLVGIVEDDDLVIEDAKVHFPTYIQILGANIPMPGSQHRFEEELRAMAGVATVGEIMEDEPLMVDETATVEDVATLIARRHVSRVPVVSDNRVIGIVSRHDLVAALAREAD